MSSSTISRVCPVCRSSRSIELLCKQDLHLVRCDQCGMIFTNPIAEGWATGVSYDRLALPYYLSPNKVESDYAPVRFERELKLFRHFCKRGTVLDVGCSTGGFLHQLQKQFPGNYEVLGVDVVGQALDYAEKNGVPVLRDSFLTHDFGPRRFSAITFWAVLEHLAEPQEFLRKGGALLEPGGIIFMLVPNFQSLAVRMLGGKYRYIFPQHINYFTMQTLMRFAESVRKLEILHAGSMHFNPVVIWQDWNSRGKFVPDEERAQLLRRTTAYKKNPVLKPLKLVLKMVEASLAQFTLADNIVLVLRRCVNGTPPPIDRCV